MAAGTAPDGRRPCSPADPEAGAAAWESLSCAVQLLRGPQPGCAADQERILGGVPAAVTLSTLTTVTATLIRALLPGREAVLLDGLALAALEYGTVWEVSGDDGEWSGHR